MESDVSIQQNGSTGAIKSLEQH